MSSSELFLEVLEPRIAPAAIINVGHGNTQGSVTYTSPGTPFQVAGTSSSDLGIADLFSADEAGHYYLVLNSGDKVKLVNSSGGFADYITVTGGKAIAFFFDKNHDGNVDSSDLTGFAVSSSAGLTVVGTVDGDIVGNLNAKTGQLSETSLLNDATSITKLNIQGAITSGFNLVDGGSIIAGGKISNVTVAGSVNEIASGSDGTYRYDFGGTGAGAGVGQAVLDSFTPTKAAGSITGVSVSQVQLIAGGVGGIGSAGGAISNIKILADTDGFQILGGAGGVGAKGGAGGAVSGVVVFGVADTLTPNNLITITGGDGADANISTGTGGAGGAVSKIYVGYEYVGTTTQLIQSQNLQNENVVIASGDGGGGMAKTGGAAGLVSSINIAVLTPDSGGDEINVHGGLGGDGSGKNGVGGGVTGVVASDFLPILLGQDGLSVAGGNGGVGAGDGGAGGSVSNLTLLADQVTVTGGDGSDGVKTGALGGSVTGITLGFLPGDIVHVQNLTVTAGSGGDASTGTAGNGGSITTVSGSFTDIRGLTNNLTAGTGGTSSSGTGGNGGSIQNVSLFEPEHDPNTAELAVHAGDGGDGVKKGGAGGVLKNVSFFGYATLFTASAGDGGDASAGTAGAGGRIDSISSQALSVDVSQGVLSVTAGAGGAGSGSVGKGGLGGSIATINIATNDDVLIQAGAGGTGDFGTAGAGGSLSGLAGTSTDNSVTILAGDAQASGTEKTGAAGGAITNVTAIAATDVTVTAGNGQVGGAGGAIKSLSWYGINPSDKPDVAYAPGGAINIFAGDGSAGLTTSGAGGSISSATGYVSTDPSSLATIQAGNGAGGAGTKGGAGGSVSSVTLFASTHSFSAGTADVIAGNGASLTVAGTAGAGGSITGVAASSGVDLHAVAAGSGGDSAFLKGKGGLGGTVSKINVFGDIGTLTGVNFGFDGMGGIFAGAGGTGGDSTLNGKAGNVIGVTADSIAAIVAGRPTTSNPETLQLVTLVDQISLRGLIAPTINTTTHPGAFTNFDQANVVGGIAEDPSTDGANIFKIDVGGTPTEVSSIATPWVLGTTKPLDGLVAAITFGGTGKNYRPQALLQTTTDPTISPTGYVLLDYRNDFDTNS